MMKATHQDDIQDSEHGRPDTCIHRKYGEALQHVLRTSRAGLMIRFIPESVIRYMHAYLAKPVGVRSRRSKNVKKAAIRISTPAATESVMVARVCPDDTEVFRSAHITDSYRKWIFTEHGEGNSLYTGSIHQQVTLYAKKRTNPFVPLYNAFEA